MKFHVGYSDFRGIIEDNVVFVDKTLFIKDIIDDTQVLLITRPRRFGKTLNLSMLYYFFNLPELIIGDGDPKPLFQGMKITQEADCLAHQNQYPVIFISFKDVKVMDAESAFNKIFELVVRMFGQHEYLLESEHLSLDQKALVKTIICRQANREQIENALFNLMEYLYLHHQRQVVVLIDEYDTPIQSGYLYQFSEVMINFMRNFFSAAFKDNVYLKKAIMTGILRVSKENLFSGLNNIAAYSLLNKRYASYFGFTEAEVDDLLVKAKIQSKQKDIQRWYNGYQFGNTVIYNPWSIISCANNSGELQPYWINTSDNALIKNVLREADESTKQQLEFLLAHKTVTQTIDENMVLQQLNHYDHSLWSLLLFSGYLRANTVKRSGTHYQCELDIPNEEVRCLYEDIFFYWFADAMGKASYENFLKSLVRGDVEEFKLRLQQFLLESMSYFDDSGRHPEKFYHGLVLGMMVGLAKTHQIKSNHESGFGRYDVMIIPKDKQQLGIIIEFKTVFKDDEALAQAATHALEQITQRRYEAELQQQGISKILKLGLAFRGKDVEIVAG